MSLFFLVLKGLLYRWRTNLAVAAGVALATAVLVGSLGAGDSVRHSLRRIALNRLGGTVFALEAGERFFRAGLAGEIAGRLGGRAASLIALSGSASAHGGEARASPVQVLGVEADFWRFSPGNGAYTLGEEEALLNEPLARRLGIGAGEEVLLRVQSASPMPGEAPLSPEAAPTEALRLVVKAVVPDRSFGGFSLRVNQVAPLNAFVSRELLARRLGQAARANTILLEPQPSRTLAEAQEALSRSWRLEDAGLSLRRAGSSWELASERVFLEPAVEEAALAEGGSGLLTYFVDRISSEGRSIPYSFVASAGLGRMHMELGEAEIVLNHWAARELEAGPGDAVELEFMIPGPGDRLERRTESFRVRGVVPIEPGDRSLMPAFPGLAGAANCRDWDPGMPIDLSRIEERDERYWDAYGGSPKAFVSLAEAQRLWANRFGRLTAVRFAGEGEAEAIGSRIRARLEPKSLGLSFRAARAVALAASGQGVDFAQLFLGLSLFLVASALLLTALLFLLSIEQRRADVGTLAALGFPPRRIRILLLAEGALIALIGSAAGLPLGLAFHRGVLAGLRTVWRDAVRTPEILPYVAPASLLAGFCAGLLAALAVITAALTFTLRTAPSGNLRGSNAGRSRSSRMRGSRVAAGLAVACAAAAGIVLGAVSPPMSFFAAGALLLAALLAASALLLAFLGQPRSSGLPTLAGVGLANASRRRTRSLAVASLLACGIFIVTAVAANRRGVPDPELKASGTGGFTLIAETAAPLERDWRERLEAPELEGARFASFRVLSGDDASCLNLNRVRQPRILAMDPASLRGSFSFVAFAGGGRPEEPWSVLEQDLGPHTIPAAADQSVITWGLGLRLGDELEYRDERGETLRIRLAAGLANSIFQGSLIVAESALLRHFPSAGGYRLILVETPSAQAAGRTLNRLWARYGVSVVLAAERLAEFNSVENTYLAIYGLLGWLGMLIGTLGLAIVVARNVAESRSELALLRAVGLGRRALLGLVFAEHLPPLALGLAGGLASSVLAVYPAASLHGMGVPAGILFLPLAAMSAAALACIAAAAGIALRSDLLPALRNE